MRTRRKRSPAGAPLAPGSPCPGRRITDPSRTPGGIVTSSVFGRRIAPAPRQVGQTVLPSFEPVPRQSGQVSVSCNVILRLTPRCASSSVSAISASTSCPRIAKPAPLRPARRPPNRLSKKSLKPPPPKPPPNISPKSPYSTLTPPSQLGGGLNSSPAFQFGPSAS